ncbi:MULTISPECIES: glycosyltransferase [unclassified Okeania]|uniref:glycosyltransferase n=1 Tax=unclassified Okeania TaxID=2634635 RepID=UPI00257F4BC3|nr:MULTISPECIES: glycosyltransferase [unclassified Okeania]
MHLHLTKQKEETQQHLPKPIRVMHIIDKLSVSGSVIHGVTRVIERWIPHFAPEKFQFCVCSLRSPEISGEIFEKQGTPIYFLSKGKFDPTTLTSLLKLIKQEKPNILHLHGYGAANFGRLASWLTGIPNIVHEHAVFPNQPLYQTIADTLLSPLTTKGIAVSEPVREFMISQRKIQPKKLETVIIGLPLAEFQAPKPDQIKVVRQELGILPDEQVITTVGRLDTQKGQIYLLKAASSILRDFPKTRFLIVGDGPDMSMLQSYAEQEGISKQVIFTGFRKDVPALLTLSDVIAMPSLWEGFPLTLLEAVNMKKPVVGTPAPGIPDVISDWETGFIVPFKNSEMLAEKIIELLKDMELVQMMGDKAWEVCQNYDISNSVQRLATIYADLL